MRASDRRVRAPSAEREKIEGESERRREREGESERREGGESERRERRMEKERSQDTAVLEPAIVRSIDCTTGSVLGSTEDSEVRFLFPVPPVPSLGVPKTWICLYSLSLIEARYAL